MVSREWVQGADATCQLCCTVRRDRPRSLAGKVVELALQAGAEVLVGLVAAAGVDQGGHALDEWPARKALRLLLKSRADKGSDLLDREPGPFGRQLELFYDLPDPRTTPTIGPMSRPDSLRSNAGA